MSYLQYNINDPVFIRLTPYGIEVYSEYYNESIPKMKDLYKRTDEDGWTRFTMRNLFCVFGDAVADGSMPFAENIRFRNGDVTVVRNSRKG